MPSDTSRQCGMKTAAYFELIRRRADRAVIKDEWIERAITSPVHEITRADGRIRRWTRVRGMDNRYLRVILLPDGETVHNAFFDRRFAS
jgi:hypothetical protein